MLSIMDIINRKPKHKFTKSGVVRIDDEVKKLSCIGKINDAGCLSEYLTPECAYGGKYLVCRNGWWHCTDSEKYLEDGEYEDCGTDVEKFVELVTTF